MPNEKEDGETRRRGADEWWTYTVHQTEVGVRFEGDHLLWWESPIFNPHAGGGAREQPLGDFVQSGPVFDWMSAEAVEELRSAVLARLRALK
jgi:hypothetical protein